ncbi:hypothetical protein [Pseudarthrobacter enclensis]|uniref:Anti-sigma factor n=1 Tax=Pseudarthrobacter enclensis TaxID=993070 RepID=A0ABT9RTC4_9MICC|nr:hypothetical protein [Pseudarthrobacter enclensis]MDP9888501.1 hypothetical protein [Pseudarthrobacter enclensis]
MTSSRDNLVTLVDGILLESGFDQDAELRDTLLSLGSLASLPAPAPTGELAALIAAGGLSSPEKAVHDESPDTPADGRKAGTQTGDELARRRRRRHRPTALGLVLVAGMGLGVGGVAASSTNTRTSAVEHLLEDWAPWRGSTTGTSAVASGYRGPTLAADGDLPGAASVPAPHLVDDAADLSSKLLRRQGGHNGTACPGPLRHNAGIGVRNCAAGSAAAAPQSNTNGGGTDGRGPGAANGTPAGAGAAEEGKAELPAATALANSGGASGPAGRKPDTSPGNAGPAPAQGQSGEAGPQGGGQKSVTPAK